MVAIEVYFGHRRQITDTVINPNGEGFSQPRCPKIQSLVGHRFTCASGITSIVLPLSVPRSLWLLLQAVPFSRHKITIPKSTILLHQRLHPS